MEFRDFLLLLWRRKTWLWGIPFLAGLFCLLTIQILSPRYEAAATLMLESEPDNPWQRVFVQPQADEEIVKTCIRLLDGNVFLLDVIKTLPFKTNLKTLRQSLRYDNPEGTKLIRLSMVGKDPQHAALVVKNVMTLAPKRLAAVLGEREVLVVEKTTVPAPAYRMNIHLGLGLTVLLSFLWTLTGVMFLHNVRRLKQEPLR
ncbi:MAG: Wzz/FepE/Etk N-terminal domain-containing protein [Bacillota bacterium]